MREWLQISRYLQTHIAQKYNQGIHYICHRYDGKHHYYRQIPENIAPGNHLCGSFTIWQCPVQRPGHVYAGDHRKKNSEPQTRSIPCLIFDKKGAHDLAYNSESQHSRVHFQQCSICLFQIFHHLSCFHRCLPSSPDGKFPDILLWPPQKTGSP